MGNNFRRAKTVLENKRTFVRKSNLVTGVPPGVAGKIMRVWDTVIAMALLFTGFFTPWEVAFLPATCPSDDQPFLYFWNRFIDGLFLVDMILQFFIIRMRRGQGERSGACS